MVSKELRKFNEDACDLVRTAMRAGAPDEMVKTLRRVALDTDAMVDDAACEPVRAAAE